MKSVEYNDKVFLNKMNDIKTTIHNSGFRIDYNKAYLIDKKMKKVVDELYNPNCEEKTLEKIFKELDVNNDKNVDEILTYYYFALYNDNLDLLMSIIDENVYLIKDGERRFYELLDSNLVKYFSKKQYLFLIKYCRNELKTFYHDTFSYIHSTSIDRVNLLKELNDLNEKLFSTENDLSIEEKEKYEKRLEEVSCSLEEFKHYKYTEEERDYLCSNFVSIMINNPFVCRSFDVFEAVSPALLTPNVIMIYGKGGILKMGDYQKELVSKFSSFPHYLERIRKLFLKYPDFYTDMRITEDILNSFSDEELYDLKKEDIHLFEKASSIGITKRYKNVLNNNSCLRKYPGFINGEVFETLSDDEIIGLSEKAVGHISKLVINSKIVNEESRFQLKKSSKRVMKMDKFIQKVKKIVS